MTTITSDNEYDSSRTGQKSSLASDSVYAEHQNNGQGENKNNSILNIVRIEIFNVLCFICH
jgi:hypothetical protein